MSLFPKKVECSFKYLVTSLLTRMIYLEFWTLDIDATDDTEALPNLSFVLSSLVY